MSYKAWEREHWESLPDDKVANGEDAMMYLREELEELCEEFDIKDSENKLINPMLRWLSQNAQHTLASIRWTYNIRFGVSHGKIYTKGALRDFQIKDIGFSWKHFTYDGYQQFRKSLVHEFCHLYQLVHNQESGHSWNFKKLCAELGGSMKESMAGYEFAEAALKSNIPERKRTTYDYYCTCGAHVARFYRRPKMNKHTKCCNVSLNQCREKITYP